MNRKTLLISGFLSGILFLLAVLLPISAQAGGVEYGPAAHRYQCTMPAVTAYEKQCRYYALKRLKEKQTTTGVSRDSIIRNIQEQCRYQAQQRFEHQCRYTALKKLKQGQCEYQYPSRQKFEHQCRYSAIQKLKTEMGPNALISQAKLKKIREQCRYQAQHRPEHQCRYNSVQKIQEQCRYLARRKFENTCAYSYQNGLKAVPKSGGHKVVITSTGPGPNKILITTQGRRPLKRFVTTLVPRGPKLEISTVGPKPQIIEATPVYRHTNQVLISTVGPKPQEIQVTTTGPQPHYSFVTIVGKDNTVLITTQGPGPYFPATREIPPRGEINVPVTVTEKAPREKVSVPVTVTQEVPREKVPAPVELTPSGPHQYVVTTALRPQPIQIITTGRHPHIVLTTTLGPRSPLVIRPVGRRPRPIVLTPLRAKPHQVLISTAGSQLQPILIIIRGPRPQQIPFTVGPQDQNLIITTPGPRPQALVIHHPSTYVPVQTVVPGAPQAQGNIAISSTGQPSQVCGQPQHLVVTTTGPHPQQIQVTSSGPQPQNVYFPQTVNRPSKVIQTTFGLGFYSGKLDEYVFGPVNKVSQIIWDVNAAPVLTADVEWHVWPWVSVGINGWAAITPLASSTSTDYDWLTPGNSEFSDVSSSEDTKLTQAYNLDFHIDFWPLTGDNYQVGIVGGYQLNEVSLQENGGIFSYDNQTDLGQFPSSQAGISYQQDYRLPYIGLSGEYQYGNFVFDALIKFSDWAKPVASDIHWDRLLVFTDIFNRSPTYVSALLTVGYYITPNTEVCLSGSWNSYSLTRTPTRVDNLQGGGAAGSSSGNSAGASYHDRTVVAGLQWNI